MKVRKIKKIIKSNVVTYLWWQHVCDWYRIMGLLPVKSDSIVAGKMCDYAKEQLTIVLRHKGITKNLLLHRLVKLTHKGINNTCQNKSNK